MSGDRRVVVLRVDPGAVDWLAAACSRRDAPPALRALLLGRSRVELDAVDARCALEWARTVPGWDDDAPPPLFVYDGSEVLARS